MVNLVTVTRQISEAEFPELDLLEALDVFFLSSAGVLEARRLSAQD
jgi:hypothetical protein